MPAFGDKARQLLLFRCESHDEAISRAMLMQPFLLRRAGEGDAGHGDVKRQAGLVLARSGGGDGVVSGREAAVARPIRVVF